MIQLLLLFVLGCGSDPLQGSLSENVGTAFAPCNESEIKFLASKHNFMVAFRPCANNNFQEVAWSPDGRLLYFQLVMTSYVMNAESPTKETRAVPVSTPLGPAQWMSNTRLAVPVASAQGAPAGAPDRIALFNVDQPQVFYVDLPEGFGHITELQRGRSLNELLALATWRGQTTVWAIDTNDGTVTAPWPWLHGEVGSFTYNALLDLAVLGQEGEVRVVHASTGSARGTFSPALRGSVHNDGHWIMLEHLGEPVSIFYQRAWDELSPGARERELRRAKRFEDNLPENYPRTVQPPTLSFADLSTGERYLLNSAYGWDFAWYETAPHYGSFLLWGFEGKEFKRNVLLGDFAGRLRAVEKGEPFLGVERFSEAVYTAGEAPIAVPVASEELPQDPAEPTAVLPEAATR